MSPLLLLIYRLSEFHTEGQLDVAVLGLSQLTIEGIGQTHGVTGLDEGVVRQVVGAAQANTKVNTLGYILDVFSIEVTNLVLTVYIKTNLRTVSYG